MPYPLAVTLHPSGSESASGTGAPVDLGLDVGREALELTLVVTAAAGSLKVKVETAPTASGPWRDAHQFEAAADGAVPEQANIVIAPVARFCRATWAVVAGPFTFELAGRSHVLYVRPADVAQRSIQAEALEGIPAERLAEACLDASNKADGYFKRRYTMPLGSWGSDVRRELAHIAAFQIMSHRGFDPSGGTDSLIEKNHDMALKWLGQVGAGTVSPEIADSTPARSGSGARVYNRVHECERRVGDEDC